MGSFIFDISYRKSHVQFLVIRALNVRKYLAILCEELYVKKFAEGCVTEHFSVFKILLTICGRIEINSYLGTSVQNISNYFMEILSV